MATCNGCSASIDFVPLPTGRKMPVDSARKAIVVEPRKGPLKVVLDDGQVVSARLATLAEVELASAPGSLVRFARTSHFASCPAADRFRAKGRTAP